MVDAVQMPSRSRTRRSAGRLNEVARRARKDQLRRKNERPLPLDEERKRQRRRRGGGHAQSAAALAADIVVGVSEWKLILAAASLLAIVGANRLSPRVDGRRSAVAGRADRDVQREREYRDQRCKLPPVRATQSHLESPNPRRRKNIHREHVEILAPSRRGFLGPAIYQ
jgi:hypothetical protein